MSRLRNFFRRGEHGSSELPVTLVILPFAIFLIFALIDMTFYMQTRSTVQQTVRDGVRTVALYGGQQANLPLNTTKKTVSTTVYENLYKNGKCTKSHCTAPPKVSCTPNRATKVGQTVSCTVQYSYSPVVRDLFFGFSNVTLKPFTLTESSVSEVGYGG